MASLKKIRSLRKNATTTRQPLSPSKLYVTALVIKNPGSGPVYVGDSTVTASTGYEIKNGEVIEELEDSKGLELDLNEIYVITSTGTSDVHVVYVKRD